MSTLFIEMVERHTGHVHDSGAYYGTINMDLETRLWSARKPNDTTVASQLQSRGQALSALCKHYEYEPTSIEWDETYIGDVQ